jgi:glycine betaine/proline transport system permease protein
MNTKAAERWQPDLTFIGGAVLIVALIFIHQFLFDFGSFPAAWDIELREPIDTFKFWVINNRDTNPVFQIFFERVSTAIDLGVRGLEDFLLGLPWPVIVVGIFLLANKTYELGLSLLATFCILFMGLMGLWEESMQTLALMTVSVILSLLIGIPLGILAARNDRVEAALRPILDGMQTMPAFVYLIPAVLFFGIARVPSVVATVIYAIPPAIRLTSLGIRQVPHEVVEAATSFGSTRRQMLWKVQIPLALPTIMAGVNQTIMMALGIVVIAAMIGAGGLGRVVLDSLRKLEVGAALEAGLAIVVLAILLDRVSVAFTQPGQPGQPNSFHLLPPGWHRFTLAWYLESGIAWLYRQGRRGTEAVAALFKHSLVQRYRYEVTSLLILLLFAGIGAAWGTGSFPEEWQWTIRQPVDSAVVWMRDHLYEREVAGLSLGTGPMSDFITLYLLNPLDRVLQEELAWPVIIALFALLGYVVSGGRLALGSAVLLLSIGLMGAWDLAMVTLSQVIVAVVLSLILVIPLGIGAGKSNILKMVLFPILDFLQTIPTFVYLVPVIMLFNIGRVPGIIASVLYALPPAIRLISLGIRQIDGEVLEAAAAFGSTSRQTLFKVQLPLAMPSIMTGVNQCVMMVLSMVVIAGMVGGAGLGLEAVNGLARSQMGRGIEAGLAIVFMAIVLDRILQGWAKRQKAGLGHQTII